MGEFVATPKILITTSDYLPLLGGLTSYTLNIESCLKANNIKYDLWHWRSTESRIPDFKQYDVILNVHYMGGLRLVNKISEQAKVINFIHGSEILFTSPNPIKKLAKKILKKVHIRYFERSHKNIFISEFTLEKLVKQGLKKNYERDMIVHNCINTENGEMAHANLNDEILRLVSIARDVPHKNLAGVILFAEMLSEISGKKIELYLTSDKTSGHSGVEVLNIKNISNEKRDEILKKSHMNLLFSLDHSESGFYEGFGLSILEGNIFGCPGIVLPSGGLPENVHHKYNGYVLEEIKFKEVEKFWNYLSENYQDLKQNSFEHVMKHHSLPQFSKVILGLLESRL